MNLRHLAISVSVTAFLLATGGCAIQHAAAKQRLARGDAALAQHKLDVALAEFQEAVRLNPELAEGHRKLGEAYKEAGKLEKAADSLETAVALDPRDAIAMFDLGEVYRLLDRMAQAIRAYAATCALEPENFEPRFRLATAYHETGELEQAVVEYQQALKLRPRDAQAWSNLGAAYDALGRRYEAIHAYKQSLECDTKQPVVLVNLATVYIHQDRFGPARRVLETAIKQDPNLSVAHERLGYCNWREQHYDEAIENYRKAITLDKENASAQAGLGVVLMTQYLLQPTETSRRDEAIEAWHRSLEIDPDQPRLRALVEKYRVRPSEPLLTAD